MSDREYLLIRGRLNRADDFTPRRCGSTSFVQRWPNVEGSDVFVECVSLDGNVLRSEPALVESELVCAPGEQTWRVRAYVALDAEAASVRLRRGERVLWEMRIPERPEVRVALEAPPVRGSGSDPVSKRKRAGRPKPADGATPGFPGGRPAVLVLETSEPAAPDLAHVTVVHRWGERSFRTVYVGPAERTIEISPDRLPGGRECRMIVIYSNGVRSATAATDPFELEPIGPVVRIIRPEDGAELPVGRPVGLEGTVQHPEHPSGPLQDQRLIWTVDEREVASGPMTSVDPLKPGEHVIGLSYRFGKDGSETPRGDTDARDLRNARVRIVVHETAAAAADAWPTWSPFTGI